MWSALLLTLAQAPATELRRYSAWLETPGGPLEFGLELEKGPDGWRGVLVNGEERIEVPHVEFSAKELLLDMPHYDSRIRASVSEPGAVLSGTWEKQRGPGNIATLGFHASLLPPTSSSQPPPTSHWGVEIAGRWAVDFATDDQYAVAVFQQRGANILGTFLTATGDYRYLCGRLETVKDYRGGTCAVLEHTVFSLACFDGAHAFLFKGWVGTDHIHGDFWSGNWHHETWTAKRDDSAELADPFAQTTWNGKTKLADLVFPDLDGKKHSLGDFAGQATLLVVLGSWCPNCNDEAKLLAELDAKYRARGLRILGLAFELTGEFARDSEQVRIFQKRHGLEALPFFLCGTADKAEATKALGLVDRVRAFPTTIFVGADGLPKAIHSGFAGPATGDEHQKLRLEFEARIEALLGGK